MRSPREWANRASAQESRLRCGSGRPAEAGSGVGVCILAAVTALCAPASTEAQAAARRSSTARPRKLFGSSADVHGTVSAEEPRRRVRGRTQTDRPVAPPAQRLTDPLALLHSCLQSRPSRLRRRNREGGSPSGPPGNLAKRAPPIPAAGGRARDRRVQGSELSFEPNPATRSRISRVEHTLRIVSIWCRPVGGFHWPGLAV